MINKILICGGRNWRDKESVKTVIESLVRKLGDEIIIIHGGATGADTLAGDVALELRLPHVCVPAKWNKYGHKAGPLRNVFMLNRFKPHLVIAFHANIDESKGTKHMVKIAEEAGVQTIVIESTEGAEKFPALDLTGIGPEA